MAGRYRAALITGATSGIGAAFAAALPGDTGLLLTGRDESRLAVEAEKLGRPGRRVETISADLATDEGRAAVASAAASFPVDLFINNAGFGAYGPSLELGRQVELDMIAVNVTAVVDLTHRLVPVMVERARANGSRAGLIVVSSTLAFVPMPNFATYSATKTFELSYAEALAEEMKDSPIDILTLCPGATRTQFFERAGMGASYPVHTEQPETVAARGMAALGRRRVLISRPSIRYALSVVWLPRALVAIGARRVFHKLARQTAR
jgi:short-subunit dehydrogenase